MLTSRGEKKNMKKKNQNSRERFHFCRGTGDQIRHRGDSIGRWYRLARR